MGRVAELVNSIHALTKWPPPEGDISKTLTQELGRTRHGPPRRLPTPHSLSTYAFEP